MKAAMEYRSLGRTGMLVSPLCLGTFNFGGPTAEDEAIQIVERALATGINFFDTADNYQQGESEKLLGRAIAGLGVRDAVILATKVHFPIGPGPNDRGNSRLHIFRACEASLKRLGSPDGVQGNRVRFTLTVHSGFVVARGLRVMPRFATICNVMRRKLSRLLTPSPYFWKFRPA